MPAQGRIRVTFERLRAQAALQVARRTGGPTVEPLPVEPNRGFARLPEPSPHDLFFDLEGDPLHPDGLEYLWALTEMLSDNVFEFVNLMDGNGDLVFGDRQAARIERRLATLEFSFGQGGYQPTAFIKRQLPANFFDLLIMDEGHEYKNEGSAQGNATFSGSRA